MTPHELNLILEVHTEKIQREYESQHTWVWLGEYYHRIKKLPPLEEALGGKKEKVVMADDDMLAMVTKLNQQFGGGEINECN